MGTSDKLQLMKNQNLSISITRFFDHATYHIKLQTPESVIVLAEMTSNKIKVKGCLQLHTNRCGV